MTRPILANDYVMIYDDFLPKEAFEPLLAYANSDSYSLIHAEAWQKAWRPGDGLPIGGTPTIYRDEPVSEPEERWKYPTHTPLDAFIEALNGVAADAEPLVGRRGRTWDSISFKPYIHPSGCGLSLHRDRHNYMGSYAYYIHREWNFHWGGQLLVFDPRERGRPELDLEPWEPFLSDAEENQIVSEPGVALCVLPKPNRLVFLAPGVYHMVTRVDARAGDRSRVSLAGFFRKRLDT